MLDVDFPTSHGAGRRRRGGAAASPTNVLPSVMPRRGTREAWTPSLLLVFGLAAAEVSLCQSCRPFPESEPACHLHSPLTFVFSTSLHVGLPGASRILGRMRLGSTVL